MKGSFRILALATAITVAAPARSESVTACVRAHTQAQVQRNAGALLDARGQLLQCVKEDCPTPVTEDCRRWLGEVEAALGRVTISARDQTGAKLSPRVWVDGRRLSEHEGAAVISVDPGSHDLRIELEGRRTVRRRIVVTRGEHVRVEALLLPLRAPALRPKGPAPEPEPERPPSAATWVVGAAGLIALGVSAGFAVSGLVRRGDLSDCKPRCEQGDVDKMTRDFLVADVAAGVGLASLGTATVLYFTTGGPKNEPGPSAGHPEVFVARQGAFFTLRTAF